MKAVVLDVPASLLEERARRGADRWDELWEGVLHMVPPPGGDHQRLGILLAEVLVARARAQGLIGAYEAGLFTPGRDDDYRVPDQIYARPELHTARGVDGAAELVVELRSPGDETYEKLDWYGGLGVREVLVVQPQTREVELFLNVDGVMRPVQPDAAAELEVRALAVRLAATQAPDDPSLRIHWEGGAVEV